LPGAVIKGLQDGADTAVDDFTHPTNFVTKPIDEFKKLPLINTLQQPSTTSVNTFSANSANKVSPGSTTGTTSSSTNRPRPLKKIADNIESTIKKLTGTGDNDKPADSDNED
jgi:hypothetical protein